MPVGFEGTSKADLGTTLDPSCRSRLSGSRGCRVESSTSDSSIREDEAHQRLLGRPQVSDLHPQQHISSIVFGTRPSLGNPQPQVLTIAHTPVLHQLRVVRQPLTLGNVREELCEYSHRLWSSQCSCHILNCLSIPRQLPERDLDRKGILT